MATTRPLRSSPIALAALTAATAVALTRVFSGHSWLLAALGCALAAHLVGGLAAQRQWSGGLTALAHVVVGFLVTLWIVVPGGTWAALPTTSGVAEWFDLLSQTVRTLRTAVVPVPPHDAALLLALIAIWATGAASQWSASRLDGVLGAIVPQLALLIAVGALGKGAYLGVAALWSAAAAAFLLCAHLERLGQARTWFHTRAAHSSRLAAGGAIAVALAVVTGVVVGPRLPGSGAEAILDYKGLGKGSGGSTGTITAISPLVDIGARLNQTPAVEMFVVKADFPARWRTVALDVFDGVTFTLNSPTGSGLLDPAPAGVATVSLQQEYRITGLQDTFVPAAYRAQEVGGDLPGLTKVAASATLVVDAKRNRLAGRTYTVVSNVPEPSVAKLQSSPMVTNPPTADVARALEVPADFSPRVRALAEQLTRNARTPYDKALALQDYLRSDVFTYDLGIPAYTKRDAIDRFVFDTRRGFCQQFAGAFAAMARTIGLPTRIAVGYLSGTKQADGYHVTTKDAHAWPEVYFTGLGWVMFEPTPSRNDNTSLQDYTGTANRPTVPSTTTSTAPRSTSSAPSAPGPRPTGKEQSPGLTVEAPGSGSGGPSGGAVVAVVGIVLVGALVLFGDPIVRALRRFRRRRVVGARARVLAAWADALDDLALHDIVRAPSRTPVEFAMRDAPALGAGSGGPALTRLARLTTVALYSPEPPSDDDADQAWDAAGAVHTALAQRLRRRPRWFAPVFARWSARKARGSRGSRGSRGPRTPWPGIPGPLPS